MKNKLLLFFAAFALIMTGCDKPSTAVKNFYNAMEDGNYEKAVTYTDTDEAEYKDMVAIMQLLHLEITDYKIISEEKTSDTTAVVKTKVSWNINNEKMSDREVKVVRKSGKWKVQGSVI